MELSNFHDFILNGDSENIQPLTQEAIDSGISIKTIVNDHLIPAMEEVGRLYEEGSLFIPEMLIAARAMQASMGVLKPYIIGNELKTKGRVVIGTVKGDLHDIGKTLVGIMLEGSGFEVCDLGVDVSPEQFVDAVEKEKPDIIAMSALLTTTIPYMETTIASLKKANLRENLIIMVGGAPITSNFANSIGADGFAEDAAGAVRKAKELIDFRS